MNPPKRPRTVEGLIGSNLALLQGAFEAYVKGPLGVEGTRRRRYVQSLLDRMWRLEKRMLAERVPVKRFATGRMEAEYRRAVQVCGVDDATVIGPLRPVREVAFRWAWCTVARERGYSLPEVARSLGRRNHSFLCDIEKNMREKKTRPACVAWELAELIRNELTMPASGRKEAV
jgi:hypothetical protein